MGSQRPGINRQPCPIRALISWPGRTAGLLLIPDRPGALTVRVSRVPPGVGAQTLKAVEPHGVIVLTQNSPCERVPAGIPINLVHLLPIHRGVCPTRRPTYLSGGRAAYGASSIRERARPPAVLFLSPASRRQAASWPELELSVIRHNTRSIRESPPASLLRSPRQVAKGTGGIWPHYRE